VGLRSFVSVAQTATASKKKAVKGPRFVSFRDEDGSFRFRLLAADGEQLLLSRSFADGKAAGQVTKQLQSGEPLDVRTDELSFSVWLDDACVADSPAFADSSSRDGAIEALRVALMPAQD
jgi:tryptophanyl-tRNA synthetase